MWGSHEGLANQTFQGVNSTYTLELIGYKNLSVCVVISDKVLWRF